MPTVTSNRCDDLQIIERDRLSKWMICHRFMERRIHSRPCGHRLADAKYVAIAMRKESFRENTILAMWELLSTLDDDPQIDVWPGLLLASNEIAFSKLIDRSIEHRSLEKESLKPLAISQVQRASETRSLQKAGVLRKLFAAVWFGNSDCCDLWTASQRSAQAARSTCLESDPTCESEIHQEVPRFGVKH